MKSVLCSVAALSWCWAFVGMAEVETAAQWAEREKGALATINETSLAQTLTSGAPALFAEIRTGGASDALAATRIAALTQYVMRPGREAVRQAYADALLAAARNAKDADVVCFFLNQLRWCGLPRQADAIRAFEHSSGAGVADLAAMTVQAVTADRSAHAPSVADTRCAAFNKELAGLAPAALTPRLLQAFDDADPAYAGVALSWARAAGGPKETRLWVAKLTAAADPVRKTMLLDMFAARRDAAAAEAVAACLSDADDGVAVAAQRALAALSGDAFAKRLPSLLTALPQGRSGAMRETLRTFPTAWLEPVLLTDFGRFGDAGKCMTLEILKERRSGRALSVGLAALDEKNEEVVVAGYRLLREIAGPEQAPLLVARLQAADGRVLSEAENAVAAAARRDAGGAYARALNDALASAADARKPPLLETAARVGGDVLRMSVENAIESPDGEVATAAVRALAEWPDDATVPALLSLAMAAPDAKRQALAVRGVLKKAEAHPELGVRFASVWKAVRTRPGNTENKKTLDALFKVAEPIPFENGFVSLFNERDLDGWIGSTNGYAVENGLLYCIPEKGGKLLTAKEYDNFILRFEFRVCTNSNNGLGIRCPIEGDAAYNGMELQILDDSGSDYTKLHDYQYHGSIYGVVPAKRGFQKKVGEWNVQEVRAVGPHITVVLNGEVIVDANLSEIKETVDGKAHPGLHNAKGHIAWLGHGTRVEWRNIRLKEVSADGAAAPSADNVPPPGFVALFDGKSLAGWKGVTPLENFDSPLVRRRASPEKRAEMQAKADEDMRSHWHVREGGTLYFDGQGHSLATTREYGDFELWVDWRLLTVRGDSGLYLRGTPQVQIWDPYNQWNIGSGGLYNNQKNPRHALEIADRRIGDWNTFYIKMTGERVTVKLNGVRVVDDTVLENYWDRSQPVFPCEQIELQCHGDPVEFKNIYLRERK